MTKFKAVQSIPSVQNIKQINNKLFICLEQGIHINGQVIQDIEFQSFYLKHKSFLYYNTKGDFCIIKKGKLFIFENCGFYPNSFNGTSILLRYDNVYNKLEDRFTFKVGLFEIDTQLKIRDYEQINNLGFYDIVGKYYLCSENRNKILLFSIETGLCVWEVQLTSKEIAKCYPLISNKILLSYTTNDNHSGLIYIDALTGNIIWDRRFWGLNTDFATLSPKGDTLISLKSGGFWEDGLPKVSGSNLFLELELSTGDFRRKGRLHELDALDLQVATFVVKNRFIYFTANHQGSFGAIAIGVLSLQTLKLLWWEIVPLAEAGGWGNFLMNSVEVAGNQFGILDKTGVLYLYEKQGAFRNSKTKANTLSAGEEIPAPSIPVAEILTDLPF